MSKINKIKLSGTTYDIQDLNATSVVNVTQAEYDALVTGGTVDPTTLYNITDAQAGDLSQYWTSAQTQSAISEATSGKVDTSTYNTYTAATDTALGGKQATLVSGTNIKTINNESILGSGNIDIQGGGGGKAVSGGTNISITTGATADTINCTLPIKIPSNYNTSIIIGNTNQNISANYSVAEGSGGFIGDTSNCSHKEGLDCKINNYAIASHVEGNNCEILTNSKYSHAEGNYTKTANESEHASGQYNVSNKASYTFGNSGNTLFSVGNGTSNNARHNAFEIRQNGDIYLSLNGQDVKLQDQLGGGGGSITIDPSLDSGSTNAVANSAITAAIEEKQDILSAGTGIDITDNVISATGGGGGGITSGEVQTMIDESISGKTNQNDNLFTIRTNVIETVVIAGGSKYRIIFAFDIIQNNQIVLSTDTVNDKSSLLSALATLGFDNKIYNIKGINYDDVSSSTSYFGEFLGHKCYAVLLNYVPDFGSITIGLKRNNVYYTLDAVGSGKYNYTYLSNKPTVTSAITSGSTDIVTSGGVYNQLGGLKLVKLSQSEYDALETKDNSTLYVIVN